MARRPVPPLDDEARARATAFEPFARGLAGEALARLRVGPADQAADEIRSLAFSTLAEAAAEYDPARCRKFPTWFAWLFRVRLAEWARDEWYRARTDRSGTFGGVDLDALAGRPGNDPGRYADQVEAFEHRIRKAPARAQSLARLRFVEGYTLDEAAAALGLTPGQAGQAMRRLKAAVERDRNDE